MGVIAIAFGVGLVAGMLVGMLGVGGGLVFVPGMVLLLGVDQHVAQGVSLMAIVLAALVGVVTHGRQKNVDTGLALRMAPFAVPGALAGAWLAGILAPQLLTWIFVLLLSVVGVLMVLSRSGGEGVSAN